MVGLDVTHSCLFTGAQLAALAGRGRFGSFLAAITGFYLQYHRRDDLAPCREVLKTPTW